MVKTIFAWIAGLALVLLFFVIISPDVLRGSFFTQEPRSSGERVYATYCVGCHGEQGLGDGPAAEFLNPKPRNFVEGEYKYFHFNESGPLPSDESLLITVRNGLPGSSMPAFALLSEQQIKDVTDYVKSLRDSDWGDAEPIQAADGPTMIEGETAAEIFDAASCKACHSLAEVGAAGGVGPELNTIGSRLDALEITESIIDPGAVIAAVCPAGPCPAGAMPSNFGERLSETQIETLVEFLVNQK